MTLERKKEVIIISLCTAYTLIYVGALSWVQNWSGAAIGLAIAFGIIWIGLIAAATALLCTRAGTSIALALFPGIAVFLAGGFNLSAALAGLLVGIVLLVFQRRVDHEISMRVRYTTTGVFGGTIKGVIMGALIALVIFALPVWNRFFFSGGVQIPPEYISAAIRPTEPLLSNFIKGYQPGDTVNQMISAQLAAATANNPLIQIPPSAINDTRNELSASLGIPLAGQETIPDIAGQVVNSYLTTLASESRIAFLLTAIVVAYLILRAAVPILAWPVLGVIATLIYFSQRIGLVAVYTTQVTIERFQL